MRRLPGLPTRCGPGPVRTYPHVTLFVSFPSLLVSRPCPRLAGLLGGRGLEVRAIVGRQGSVPGEDVGREALDDLRVPVGEVGGLGPVLGEVVELGPRAVVFAEQLPATLADGEVGEVFAA